MRTFIILLIITLQVLVVDGKSFTNRYNRLKGTKFIYSANNSAKWLINHSRMYKFEGLSITKDTSSKNTYTYSKKSSFVGGSLRVFDRTGTLIPLNVGIHLRYMKFISNKLAIGASLYLEKQYYKQFFSGDEYLGGFSIRYYVGKSKNNFFGEINILGGKSLFYSTKNLIIGIYSGIGYSRIITKKLAFETSVKYLLPIADGAEILSISNNILLDVGLNYNFK